MGLEIRRYRTTMRKKLRKLSKYVYYTQMYAWAVEYESISWKARSNLENKKNSNLNKLGNCSNGMSALHSIGVKSWLANKESLSKESYQ